MTSLATSTSAAEAVTAEAHEGHADLRLFGLATFLVADGMTFAGFFAAYLTFRAVNPLPAGSTYELELLLPSINTMLLLVSSYTSTARAATCCWVRWAPAAPGCC